MSLKPELEKLYKNMYSIKRLYTYRIKGLYIKYKNFKIPSVSVICEKASKYSKTYLCIRIVLFLIIIYFFKYLLMEYPHQQVGNFSINSSTEVAKLENSYRATLAQILGGVAIGIGLYYTWRRITIADKNLELLQTTFESNQINAEKNLKVSQEGQITERFTRAVNQLGAIDKSGNPAIEIRLGGIYALERIANESEKDYWPIMEILTAYVRKNSGVDSQLKENHMAIKAVSMDIQADENINKEYSEVQKKSFDIQTILTVIGKRQSFFWPGEIKTLDLSGANLSGAKLEGAILPKANLSGAKLEEANLTRANLFGTNFTRANLSKAGFIVAKFFGATLREANLSEACLSGADLFGTDLTRVRNLKIEQLSIARTLYRAKLDKELLIPLKEEYPGLFEKTNHSFCVKTYS